MKTLNSVLLLREAFNNNIESIANHYNEPIEDWKNTAIELTEKSHGYKLPIDFYRELYNLSVEWLKETEK